ncbi:MAG: SPOR domain-containing protein [Alphaproteobacteria bacterium]|nr:SPOR domain-containing protein [Alphaproteobacteria bacterium]
MRSRIEPMAATDELDIPMPAMTPAWRAAGLERRERMDAGTRRLAIFAGAIGGALLLLVGVWGFSGRHSGGVPVIESDSRPVRTKPTDPGGMQVTGANDSILSGEADGKTALAPPPEAPAPQALREAERAAAPPPAAAKPAPEKAAPDKTAAEKPAPDRTERVATATRPEPTPAPAPASAHAEAARTEAPRADVVRTDAAPARPATKPAAAAKASSGVVLVQLGALETEGGAKTEWERLVRKYGDLLSGHRPTISRTEHAGKTYWRVRTGGFADSAAAVLFCERVKQKGGGCAVVS